MRLLLFLILTSTSCFSQNDVLERRFYTVFPVDSLIQGDWKLVKTYINNTPSKLDENSTFLKIGKDSLIQVGGAKERFYKRPAQYLYRVNLTNALQKYQLDIFHQKRKKTTNYIHFDLSFRNLNELVLQFELDLDERIGTTKIQLTHVYERYPPSNQLTQLLSMHSWYFCSENYSDFLSLHSEKKIEFSTDSISYANCVYHARALQFQNSSNEVTYSFGEQSHQVVGIFSSNRRVILDEQTKNLYFFCGNAILVYHIEEIAPDKLILKQDHELTLKLNLIEK